MAVVNTVKKNVANIDNDTNENEPLVDKTDNDTSDKSQAQKEKKEYDMHDMVRCMCVTAGSLNFTSKKSNNTYYWGNYGDIIEVEYQDIQHLQMLGRNSLFLTHPLFIILDTDCLDVVRDKQLIEFTQWYQKYPDMYELFNNTSDGELVKILKSAPKGFVEAAYYFVNDMLASGVLQSIAVIKTIKELTGRNLEVVV